MGYNKEVNTRKCKKYRQTQRGKEAILRAIKKYETKNPERRKAWAIAEYRVDIKPCIKCGKSPAHRHHPDISKPLEVIFLCPLHHKENHMLL